jgi:hypothetical protein
LEVDSVGGSKERNPTLAWGRRRRPTRGPAVLATAEKGRRALARARPLAGLGPSGKRGRRKRAARGEKRRASSGLPARPTGQMPGKE